MKNKQEILQQEETEVKNDFQDIQTRLEELKANQAQKPATRIVKLKYKSCCGCGCDWITLYREVPWDSKLKNGNKTDDSYVSDMDEDEYAEYQEKNQGSSWNG